MNVRLKRRVAIAIRLSSAALVAAAAAFSDARAEKRHSAAELVAYRPGDFVAPMTSAAGRAAIQREEIAALGVRLALPPGPRADAELPAILAAITMFKVEQAAGLERVLAALPTLERRSIEQQRAVLTAAHALYASESAPLLRKLLPRLATPREFAIAAYTIRRAQPDAVSAADLQRQMEIAFPEWPYEPRLRALAAALADTDAYYAVAAPRPPLSDLLAAPLRPGWPVIYSLQRRNREQPGLALVRAADGRFERNADGSLFAIPHLALARSNLPGTITFGNTPQGLFTIIGAGTAADRWIGPTPYLHSMLPIEASVGEFEHATDGGPGGTWSEARYESFLPDSWRNWLPIKEAWLAGQAGRDEILLHGTTVNPAYYRGASYFPATPAAGCLVAHEAWSSADGMLLRSDQLSLAQVFARGGRGRGYLVVVDVDDREQPVQLAELLAEIQIAEARTRKPP